MLIFSLQFDEKVVMSINHYDAIEHPFPKAGFDKNFRKI